MINRHNNIMFHLHLKKYTLDSSTPYSWYVTAVGENPTSQSDSDTWKFYLVGEPLVNYSPFPPELLSPRSASTVTAIDGEIILNGIAQILMKI